MITDDDLLAFLNERPARLIRICEHFGLPYAYSAVQRGPAGEDWGYTQEAKRIRNQLQRLRKARRVDTDQGARWKAR